MDGLSLRDRYGKVFAEIANRANTAATVDDTNVYQEINPYSRKMMDDMVSENLLPGSRLEGREHFEDFYRHIKAGKHGLILCEHYSNLDLPCIVYLLEHDNSEFGPAIARDLIAIAGMKLNEEDPRIKSMAEGYTRIVIYPKRSLTALSDSDREAEEARGRKINMAAMRALDTVRKAHKPVIVFPSGTRYRPGKPETKRGLRGIDSYLRLFDCMILLSLNGQCLRFDPDDSGSMVSDRVYADKVIVTASPVIDCKEFRDAAFAESADNPDLDQKQYTIDKLMQIIEDQHEQCEKIRLQD
jgi:glycerol-3-phosphate O-acyltransferase